MHRKHPPRLHRLSEIHLDHPVYFITACTHQRKPLLADAPVHQTFRAFCKFAPEHGAFVGAYVLMPDHLHLFVSVCDSEAITLSQWVKALKKTLSATINEQRILPPHWQKGFFDHLLRSDESYTQKAEYILDNPVRAGLAATAHEWPFLGDFAQL